LLLFTFIDMIRSPGSEQIIFYSLQVSSAQDPVRTEKFDTCTFCLDTKSIKKVKPDPKLPDSYRTAEIPQYNCLNLAEVPLFPLGDFLFYQWEQ
jgi:hypothetical protein